MYVSLFMNSVRCCKDADYNEFMKQDIVTDIVAALRHHAASGRTVQLICWAMSNLAREGERLSTFISLYIDKYDVV